jgi:hypothetical protein
VAVATGRVAGMLAFWISILALALAGVILAVLDEQERAG